MDESNAYLNPGSGGAVSGLSTGHYEFSFHEQEKIRKTGQRATQWGWFAITTGALMLIAVAGARTLLGWVGLIGDLGLDLKAYWEVGVVVGLVPTAMAQFVTGWLYVTAGRQLILVAETEGNDVEHLMVGLNKLKQAFRIEAVMVVVGFVLGILLMFSLASLLSVGG